jgi:LmbE family N-acetylglucosaminyl deacetylase
MSGRSTADAFLSRLAGRETIPGDHVAAILAHPDDEVLGLGAQLPRLPGITLVHVTDGAPRDLVDARRLGFATAEAYAAERRRELEKAAALAGIGSDALIGFGFPDQEAAFHLSDIARLIADVLQKHRIRTVFTHSYEGGHPDHDATAFAVHAAVALVERGAGRGPGVIEMPFYHAAPDGWVRQNFLAAVGSPELRLDLDPGQQAFKSRLFAAHVTQKSVLDSFSVATERFRVAPHDDFSALPPVEELLYEREGWGLDRHRWIALVRDARRTLEIGGCA